MNKHSNALENACRLSIAWLDAHPGEGMQAHYRHTYRTFAHSPRAMRKSMLFALEALAPELFCRVRSTVFRTWDKPTLVSDFVMRWALAQGSARIRDYAHVYVATGEAAQVSGMDRVIRDFGDLHFFCLNDTLDNAPPDDIRLHQLKETLQGLFGSASRYERDGTVQQAAALSVPPVAGNLADAASSVGVGLTLLRCSQTECATRQLAVARRHHLTQDHATHGNPSSLRGVGP
jgi:hypothetical protein